MFMELQEEGSALRGLIHEVRAKLLLLRSRLPRMDDEEKEIAMESIERMYDELTKYSNRADEICLELSEYVSDIYGMDEEEEEWAFGSEESPDS